nr:MAG TPA: hypothetical protein [Caudoviricetes sp.]
MNTCFRGLFSRKTGKSSKTWRQTIHGRHPERNVGDYA